MVTAIDLHTIWQRTFKGENIHEFPSFRPTHDSFLHERNLDVLCPLMIGFSIPQKFSPQNGHFLPIRESFLPRKFPAVQ